jgi:histidinol phosphatase-like PHP family hydrolase
LNFFASISNQPVFVAMQAEGREWTKLFSKEAISKFDYIFTDAMTFFDESGKRIRLWINDELQIKDKQKFMDMYVERIVSILENEPIDIYANATFLPEAIASEYDKLWTEERIRRVVGAAVSHNVAIEINDRYKIPSAKFIKIAKQAGAKFSFGTNNGGKNDIGRLEYCIKMVKECNLTWKDMFMPPSKNKR